MVRFKTPRLRRKPTYERSVFDMTTQQRLEHLEVTTPENFRKSRRNERYWLIGSLLYILLWAGISVLSALGGKTSSWFWFALAVVFGFWVVYKHRAFLEYAEKAERDRLRAVEVVNRNLEIETLIANGEIEKAIERQSTQVFDDDLRRLIDGD